MSSIPCRLGTRGSQLALYQAHLVARLLAEAGGPRCEIVVIRTSGDRLQDAPLSEVGGKRLFVKEIEDALLRNEVDIAVHSSKDMPAVLPDGLVIAGVLAREDPHDGVVLPRQAQGTTGAEVATIQDLVARVGPQPTIGTSSVRRIAELTRVFPKARFAAIRGNLDTRLRKLDEGGYDMLVLAAAGLKRLGHADRISLTLESAVSVPAPGQGIIAVEIRSGDGRARQAVETIRDARAWTALVAERAVVERLGGGCQTPIGALAVEVGEHEIELSATVVALDGSRAVRVSMRASDAEASALGIRVAEELLAKGADEILEDVRRQQGIQQIE